MSLGMLGFTGQAYDDFTQFRGDTVYGDSSKNVYL